jgi:DNA-binding transcriptional MerR regulator
MTTREVMTALGVTSRMTIYYYQLRGLLTPIDSRNGVINRYPRAEVEALIASRQAH